MTLTENEASGKWCPFARYVEKDGDGGANRFASDVDDCQCLGSECMAWRWQPLMADEAFTAAVVKAADEIGDDSPQKSKAAKHVAANRAKYGLPTAPFQGFCGLAGTPLV